MAVSNNEGSSCIAKSNKGTTLKKQTQKSLIFTACWQFFIISFISGETLFLALNPNFQHKLLVPSLVP